MVDATIGSWLVPPISPEMSAVAIRHPRRAASFVTRVQYKTRNSYNPDEECLSKHAILRRPNYGRWGRKFCVQLTLYTLPSYDRVSCLRSSLSCFSDRSGERGQRNGTRTATLIGRLSAQMSSSECNPEPVTTVTRRARDHHTHASSTRSVGPPGCAQGSTPRAPWARSGEG